MIQKQANYWNNTNKTKSIFMNIMYIVLINHVKNVWLLKATNPVQITKDKLSITVCTYAVTF